MSMYKDLLKKFNKHTMWTQEYLERTGHTHPRDLEVLCATIDEVRLNVSVPKQLESLKKVLLSVLKRRTSELEVSEWAIEMQAQTIYLLLSIQCLPDSVNEKAIQKFRSIFKKAFKTSVAMADELVKQDIAELFKEIDESLSDETVGIELCGPEDESPQ